MNSYLKVEHYEDGTLVLTVVRVRRPAIVLISDPSCGHTADAIALAVALGLPVRMNYPGWLPVPENIKRILLSAAEKQGVEVQTPTEEDR